MTDDKPPAAFIEGMQSLAKRTNYEKLDVAKIKEFWESLRFMPPHRLKWTLTEADRQCTKWPTTGMLWKISKDYRLPPKQIEKRDMSDRDDCTLREAIKDPDIRKHWDKLDPEMKEGLKKMEVDQ